MSIFDLPIKNRTVILALGAESTGNFSVLKKDKIYFSKDFGDLLDNKNFNIFKREVLSFLDKEKIKPNLIITDLHPLMKTTLWGEILARKFKARHVQVQHHHAHIFASIGDRIIHDTSYKVPATIYGIAIDGTGFGIDEKILGGECFAISNFPVSTRGDNPSSIRGGQFSIFNQFKNLNDKNTKQKFHIERIGGLENQTMIGGALAIQEPARMLVALLAKILSEKEVYYFVKKYYSKNEFNLIYAQLNQNFNCLETSSTGRILDAVSLLLGFCENKRTYKHEAIDLLELNSTKPYRNIKPRIEIIKSSLISNDQCSMLNEFSMTKFSKKYYILNTTFLFEYLIKNIKKDRARLAATAQLYIAQGLLEIIKLDSKKESPLFIAGGIGKNRIISQYLTANGAYQNKKIPLGDEGLSFGQIVCYLLSK